MSEFNGWLQYKPVRKGIQGFRFWVMEYSQAHQLSGTQAQSKMFQHFYARSYAAAPISVTARVRDDAEYHKLAKYIRGHHEELMRNPGMSNVRGGELPLMGLGIKDEGIYVTGWVESFEAGAKRFNVAPEVSFDFVVVQDSHSANTNMRPLSVTRAWWTGQMVRSDEIIEGTMDDIENVRKKQFKQPLLPDLDEDKRSGR